MKNTWWMGGLLLCLALGGCETEKADKDETSADDDDDDKKKKKKSDDDDDDDKGDDDDDDKKKKKKSDDDDKKEPKPEAEAEPEPEPVKCGALNEIPEIPSERSDPPSTTEWSNACDINTQGAGSHAQNCTMKIKREWLQVTCRGNMLGYEQFDANAFGEKGLDYFEHNVPGEMASFVVRLVKGRNPKVRLCRQGERASLFVSWPPSESKPKIVALATGPACDGSSWGTM